MAAPTRCPVCLGRHSGSAKLETFGLLYRVACPICGRFDVERNAWDDILDPASSGAAKLTPLMRSWLSHRLRMATESDPEQVPVLTSASIERIRQGKSVGPSPAIQAANAIRYIGDQTLQTGERINQLPPEFYAIIGALGPDQASEIVAELQQKGLIDAIVRNVVNGTFILNIKLTLDGWQQYEAEKQGRIAGKYGFIAMKFGDGRLDTFVENVIKPAIKECIGHQLVDMRDVARAGIIDNVMRAQIRDAAFVIADLTHDNHGAYWESGYAEGLGKPVIYICEKAKFDSAKTHFDTNHCTTVCWSPEDPTEFSRQLIATLRRSLNLFSTSETSQ